MNYYLILENEENSQIEIILKKEKKNLKIMNFSIENFLYNVKSFLMLLYYYVLLYMHN